MPSGQQKGQPIRKKGNNPCFFCKKTDLVALIAYGDSERLNQENTLFIL